MTDDRPSEILRCVELVFILAVALSVIALAPLALPLLRIGWSAVGSRAARAAVVPNSPRDVELSVRRRLYGNRRGPAPVRPGCLIQDRYHLLGWVGTGGMAIVYRANDEFLKREVAIKFIAERLAGNPAFVERFRDEGWLCAHLAHPNIVAILDAGVQPRDFIVMEYVDGLDARRLLQRRGRLTPGETVHIVAQICDALTYAHRQDVVHGDVSPSNILVRRSDGVAKLADFGLASRAAGVGSTHEAATRGTPGHVAPEVLGGANRHRGRICIASAWSLTGSLSDRRDCAALMQAPRPCCPPLPRGCRVSARCARIFRADSSRPFSGRSPSTRTPARTRSRSSARSCSARGEGSPRRRARDRRYLRQSEVGFRKPHRAKQSAST